MARKAPPAASAAARTNASVAATRRSRTGCLTCRKRKLKCDETKPICLSCQKGNRECVPADTITFRNHHNPSLNNGGEGSVGGLNNYFNYKDSFEPDAVWVRVPQNLTFVNIDDPFEQDQEAESQNDVAPGYQQMATHTLEALSNAATRDSTQLTSSYAVASYPTTSYTSSNAAFAYQSPYATRQEAADTVSSAVIDPNLEKAGKGGKGEEEEVATLLRRFSEEGV